MNDAAAMVASPGDAVQMFFASGVLLVCVLACGLWGLRARLFKSILFFGSLVTASVASFAWCGGTGSIAAPAGWSLFTTYMIVFGVAYLLTSTLLYLFVQSHVVTYSKAFDRLGGTAVGVTAGLLLASAMRVGLAMAPFAAPVLPSPQQLQVDFAPRLLRMASRILSSKAEVRRAWLQGAGQRLAGGNPGPGEVAWSEPFVDFDINGVHDADEPFLDKDGNGAFTAAFAAGDAATSRDVRVGVMDRYWLGNWTLVTVMDANAVGRR